ncbi:DUF5134 domain-containing protein [Streptomyces laurentii]|uniref:DUF5134 domain-containing protein n=1 Tax=Streptomyces laurentii TaxID=39478 RepID=UPI00368B4F58
MHGPTVSGWLLVVLCGASGVYCLARMVRMTRLSRERDGHPAREPAGAGSEALMGFGMAAMALPAAVLTPPAWSWAVYAVVFGLAALYGLAAVAWRGGTRRRGRRHGGYGRYGGGSGRFYGHHLHHLVGSLAMVYMAVAMAPAAGAGAQGGHGGHGGGHGDMAAVGGIPLLTGVLLVYFAGYALLSGARLVPVPVAAPAGAGVGVGGAGSGTFGAGGSGRSGSGGAGSGVAELMRVCRLTMALAMLAMLVTL